MLPTPHPPSSTKQSLLSAATSCIRRLWVYCIEEVDDPMAERRADALLVASSVIAAMNYQVVMSPPGGSYQDTEYRNGTIVDKPEQELNANITHQAGQAIAAYIAPGEYRRFTTFNTMSFAFSMTTMFLLLSGISLKRRIFSFLLTLSTFATITATAYSYKCGMEATTPDHDEKLEGWIFVNHLVNGALILWYVIAGVAFAAFIGKLLEPSLTSAYRRATQNT